MRQRDREQRNDDSAFVQALLGSASFDGPTGGAKARALSRFPDGAAKRPFGVRGFVLAACAIAAVTSGSWPAQATPADATAATRDSGAHCRGGVEAALSFCTGDTPASPVRSDAGSSSGSALSYESSGG